MPQYGIASAEAGEGLLPWSWAEKRLVAAHNYWVASTRPDGRPHAMPVWGVWLDGRFVFSTATGSRKGRNLSKRAECVVTTERADEAVIVEGLARVIDDAAVLAAFKRAYDAKYAWDMDVSQGGIWCVEPHTAFAFIETDERFATTATRFSFER